MRTIEQSGVLYRLINAIKELSEAYRMLKDTDTELAELINEERKRVEALKINIQTYGLNISEYEQ